MFNWSFLLMDSTNSNVHFHFNVLLHLRLFHHWRPRGSQSGRANSRDESFQAWAEEPLGTHSHRTISKWSRECWFLIGHKKCFALLYPIGKQHILSLPLLWRLFSKLTSPGSLRMRLFCFVINAADTCKYTTNQTHAFCTMDDIVWFQKISIPPHGRDLPYDPTSPLDFPKLAPKIYLSLLRNFQNFCTPPGNFAISN